MQSQVSLKERDRGRFGQRKEEEIGLQKQRLEWCSHKTRKANSHQELDEARNGFSPRDPRRM